jgi:cbb3-type cytochrome oxidase subunit 3
MCNKQLFLRLNKEALLPGLEVIVLASAPEHCIRIREPEPSYSNTKFLFCESKYPQYNCQQRIHHSKMLSSIFQRMWGFFSDFGDIDDHLLAMQLIMYGASAGCIACQVLDMFYENIKPIELLSLHGIFMILLFVFSVAFICLWFWAGHKGATVEVKEAVEGADDKDDGEREKVLPKEDTEMPTPNPDVPDSPPTSSVKSEPPTEPNDTTEANNTEPSVPGAGEDEPARASQAQKGPAQPNILKRTWHYLFRPPSNAQEATPAAKKTDSPSDDTTPKEEEEKEEVVEANAQDVPGTEEDSPESQGQKEPAQPNIIKRTWHYLFTSPPKTEEAPPAVEEKPDAPSENTVPKEGEQNAQEDFSSSSPWDRAVSAAQPNPNGKNPPQPLDFAKGKEKVIETATDNAQSPAQTSIAAQSPEDTTGNRAGKRKSKHARKRKNKQAKKERQGNQ